MFYKYDLQTKEYIGEGKDAFYKLNGKLLDGYTKVKLPEFIDDEICKFIDNKWQVSVKPKDYRGTWIDINDDTKNITKLDVIPNVGYAKEDNNKWYFADGSLATDITFKQLKTRLFNSLLSYTSSYLGKSDFVIIKKAEEVTLTDYDKQLLNDRQSFRNWLAKTKQAIQNATTTDELNAIKIKID